MVVDFHSHTCESDGSLAPDALAALMRTRGVAWWSITDHDTMRAYEALDATGIRLVTGIEINTTWEGADVHILGYGLPLGPSPIASVLEANRAHRRARMERIVDGLTAAGYPITMAAVEAESGGGHALGRPHVAKALIRAGLVRDVESAFRDLLSAGKPGYAPSSHITPEGAIDAIARSGGLPVLAHPGRVHDGTILEKLVEAGLRGLEVFYPRHDAQLTSHFREQARRFGLIMTAGSDFHDARYNTRGVGMEVDADDIGPFLDAVA